MILLDSPIRTRSSWWRAARVALVAQVVLLLVVNFSGANSRSGFTNAPIPPWRLVVAYAYVLDCHDRPSDQIVTVTSAFLYTMQLSCRDLAP